MNTVEQNVLYSRLTRIVKIFLTNDSKTLLGPFYLKNITIYYINLIEEYTLYNGKVLKNVLEFDIGKDKEAISLGITDARLILNELSTENMTLLIQQLENMI